MRIKRKVTPKGSLPKAEPGVTLPEPITGTFAAAKEAAGTAYADVLARLARATPAVAYTPPETEFLRIVENRIGLATAETPEMASHRASLTDDLEIAELYIANAQDRYGSDSIRCSECDSTGYVMGEYTPTGRAAPVPYPQPCGVPTCAFGSLARVARIMSRACRDRNRGRR